MTENSLRRYRRLKNIFYFIIAILAIGVFSYAHYCITTLLEIQRYIIAGYGQFIMSIMIMLNVICCMIVWILCNLRNTDILDLADRKSVIGLRQMAQMINETADFLEKHREKK